MASVYVNEIMLSNSINFSGTSPVYATLEQITSLVLSCIVKKIDILDKYIHVSWLRACGPVIPGYTFVTAGIGPAEVRIRSLR